MRWGDRIEINCSVTCSFSGDNPLVQTGAYLACFFFGGGGEGVVNVMNLPTNKAP